MASYVIDRGAFVERWCDRASSTGDPIDEFFSLWIALIVCARPELRPKDFSVADTDRCAVLWLLQSSRKAIFREIICHRDELIWLANRKGRLRGDAIVDVHDFVRNATHLRQLFSRLSDHYSNRKPAKPGLVAQAVIELLNHVRNNLFHGIKDPDDVDDRELLRRLNPLLRAVLKGVGQCRQAGGAGPRF